MSCTAQYNDTPRRIMAEKQNTLSLHTTGKKQNQKNKVKSESDRVTAEEF